MPPMAPLMIAGFTTPGASTAPARLLDVVPSLAEAFTPARVPPALLLVLDAVVPLVVAVLAAELAVLLPERLASMPPELLTRPLLKVVVVEPSAFVTVVLVKLLLLADVPTLALASPIVRLAPAGGAAAVLAVDVPAVVPAGRAALCANAEPATAITTVATTYAGESMRIAVSLVMTLKS